MFVFATGNINIVGGLSWLILLLIYMYSKI